MCKMFLGVHQFRFSTTTCFCNMEKKYKVAKSYPRSSFRKVIKAKTNLPVANDNSDMLVYLVYIEYLHQLLSEAQEKGMTAKTIEQVHENLLKRFQG